jgi:hypothetical protein
MFKSAKKILIFLGSLTAIFIIAHFALAQTPDLGTAYGAATGLAATDPRIIIGNVIRIILGLLGVVAIGLIIYGGFLWMTASGNEEQIEKAKKVLISALIGLVIILSAFAIATFIINSLVQATNNTSGNSNDNNSSSVLPAGTGGAGQPCGGTGALGSCGGVCTVGSCDMATCLCPTAGGTGTNCNSTTTPGVCISDGSCDSNHFCDSSSNCTCQPLVAAGGPCGLKSKTCQPLKICQVDLACHLDTCECDTALAVGQPCSDSATSCQADNNLCPNDQTCDDKCTCQKYPIITSISPVGGFCENENDHSCSSNGDCYKASPCDMTTPNAAQGNIITISGKYFGTTAGTVDFWDGSDFKIAGIDPKTVNSSCTDAWTDNQIIVVLPNNDKLTSGAVKITTADGKTYQSDGTNGQKINLVINTIARPGLCSTTAAAKVGTGVDYSGVNLVEGVADFGVYNSPIVGINSSFITNAGYVVLPSLTTGKTSTFVKNKTNGQNSNYLSVNVLPSAVSSGPFISTFSPATGKAGQYVTITGSGFGSSQGTSKVYFGSASGVLADLNFPTVCADSIWSDKQIIVKVPQNISPTFSGILTIALGNGTTITTQNSTPQTFKVNTALPLTPSLCNISPKAGQAGTAVTLSGENFGAFDMNNSLVRFFSKQDVNGAGLTWDGADTPNTVTATVPVAAATGPVIAINNGLASNNLNFMVGSCLQATDPSTACGKQFCCPSNTSKAGSCVDNVAKDCSATASSSVYQFSFTTKLGDNTSGTGSNTGGGSCQQNSLSTGSCLLGTCPNAPGSCSGDKTTCTCCCQINANPSNCCAGLTCGGTCGSGAGYGVCGGCKKLDTNGVVSSTLSDAACSCVGHTGQFCDTSDSKSVGVCRDCADIGSDKAGQIDCSAHSQCCVDATKNNACVNTTYGNGDNNIFQTLNIPFVDNLNVADYLHPIKYCGYFQCKTNNTGCDKDKGAVSHPTASAYFASSTACDSKCGDTAPALGASCDPLIGATNKTATCDPNNSCGNPLSCLLGDGSTGNVNSTCGTCCCNPNSKGSDGINHQCDYLTQGKINTVLNLSCVPNVGPCDGAGRGLCCGCKSNNDCDANSYPMATGCGSDTCCRTRPKVTAISPSDSLTGICTNAEITVTFDQQMDASSFNSNNFILIEQVDKNCPPGTSPLSKSVSDSWQNKNIFAKKFDIFMAAAQKRLPWIFGQETLAFYPDVTNHNYCSVPGSVFAQQVDSTETKLVFQPSGVLNPDTIYFAVAKGNQNLNDNSVGLRSYWGISLNGIGSKVMNRYIFDSASYSNSYIWSFQTKKSNGEDDGICAIKSVSIFPDSYLFNTVENSLIENDDNSAAKSFDTVNDGDKVFTASALADDGQPLFPVTGYAWNWSWSFFGNNITTFVNPKPFAANTSSQLIRADAGVINSNTQVKALINLTDTANSSAGGNASSTADIYVFMCTTTWPAMIGGTWHPWRDSVEGSPANSGFPQANYQLYYCRDNGAAGNLPDASVTTIGSNLGCTDPAGNAACTAGSSGKSCGNNGTCQDVLKQSYFFSQ